MHKITIKLHFQAKYGYQRMYVCRFSELDDKKY